MATVANWSVSRSGKQRRIIRILTNSATGTTHGAHNVLLVSLPLESTRGTALSDNSWLYCVHPLERPPGSKDRDCCTDDDNDPREDLRSCGLVFLLCLHTNVDGDELFWKGEDGCKEVHPETDTADGKYDSRD